MKIDSPLPTLPNPCPVVAHPFSGPCGWGPAEDKTPCRLSNYCYEQGPTACPCKDPDSTLLIGSVVYVKGLLKYPKFNGQKVKIMEKSLTAGSFNCRVMNTGEYISVPMKNLTSRRELVCWDAWYKQCPDGSVASLRRF